MDRNTQMAQKSDPNNPMPAPMRADENAETLGIQRPQTTPVATDSMVGAPRYDDKNGCYSEPVDVPVPVHIPSPAAVELRWIVFRLP